MTRFKSFVPAASFPPASCPSTLAIGLTAWAVGALAQSAADLPAPPKPGTVIRLHVIYERPGQPALDYDQTITVTAADAATYTGERRTPEAEGPALAGKLGVAASTDTFDRNPLLPPRQQKFLAGTAALRTERIETELVDPAPIFPPIVGKAWVQISRTDTYDRDGTKKAGRDYREECSVGPEEKLTVAAGAFDVLPIDCGGVGADLVSRSKRYYAPAIARVVKTVTTVSVREGAETRFTVELRGIDEPPGQEKR